MPILATVSGQPVAELPPDLFIPPDALEVLLDTFTGPLDLLLYLIRRQNLDILNIPMALITQQYLDYIQLMQSCRLELAADYLVMAAMLIEIKSRLLLPKQTEESTEEDDPRLALVKKLQAYEQFKQAAMYLDELPRDERDSFPVSIDSQDIEIVVNYPAVQLDDLLSVMLDLFTRQGHNAHHQITQEPLSVRERMVILLERLQTKDRFSFSQLLIHAEGRMGLVVTLLAVLELARQSLVSINQTGNFSPIYLQGVVNG